jgi:cobalt-zinc-cadmium resistance protein CzcA
MTAVAAMLALIPLALDRNRGALVPSELGGVVNGGLFRSTLLTLVVLPVVFSLVGGLKMRFSHQPPTVAAEPVSVAGSDPRWTPKQ